ncbi:MAG: hypothetical protein HGA98_05395 [Deltaproteobacteria bacterium]|nr:hypothetical protein [Deltaproteobacteria bacterium]
MDQQEEPELTPPRPLPDTRSPATDADPKPFEAEAELSPAEASASAETDATGSDPDAAGDDAPAFAAAESPPEPQPAAAPADNGLKRILIGAGVAVVVVLVGAGFLWKTSSDLGALRREVAVLKAQTQRAQVAQQRGSLLRVRAELQALRQTLPPDLSLDLDKAEALLVGIDERLKASP